MTVLFRAERVVKRFGGVVALAGVDVAVDEGEFVGLIGPNGSGKTTFVNVATGVYRPDEGRVFFRGRDVTGMPPHRVCRMGIARTFQIPQPIPEMTVLENVLLAASFCGGGGEEDAWRALRLCGLEDKAYEEAGRLTLVEKRMLELARALSTRPSLLFLDEVAAGLRPGEIDRLAGLLEELNREGLALVWIEHNVAELVKHVRRLVVMNQGRVIADGAPREVLSMPEVVESYLGRLAAAPTAAPGA